MKNIFIKVKKWKINKYFLEVLLFHSLSLLSQIFENHSHILKYRLIHLNPVQWQDCFKHYGNKKKINIMETAVIGPRLIEIT